MVVVVFDELPTATLMERSGTRIDRRRFPGFARLAAHSTLYRNNTTVADFTGRAMPAIETGTIPRHNALPVASQYPDSIFTLLGRRYRFNVSEPVTRVCPRSLCGRRGAAASGAAGKFAQGKFVPPKPREFRRFLERIPRGGRSLNFIHFEVPHAPYHFLPDGRAYNYAPISDLTTPNAQRWAAGPGGVATSWQRHYIQTGYADTLTGRLIARLRKLGIWRRALVVVTADNGASFDPGKYRRIAKPGNLAAIANTPLFVRYPGQTQGQVSDLHTETIDIVPTVARVLGIELPYEADGQPISEIVAERPVRVANSFRQIVEMPISGLLAQREIVLGDAARALGARTSLFALGPRSDLIGRRAPAARGSGGAHIDRRLDFDRVRLGAAKLPAFVNGTVRGSLAGEVIAIGVNGRIAATCRAFRFRGRTRWGAVIRPSTLRRGRNSVGVHLLRGGRLVPLGAG